MSEVEYATTLNPHKILKNEIIDFSFLDTMEQIKITEDGGVIMYKNKEDLNQQYAPIEHNVKGAKVKILYEGRNQSGELLDTTRNVTQAVNLKLFSYDTQKIFISGIHIAVSHLAINQEAWFKFMPKYHFSQFEQQSGNNNNIMLNQDNNSLVQQNEPIFYKIKLQEYNLPQIQPQTLPQFLDFFQKQKEIGNDLFKKNKIDLAYQAYDKAIKQIKMFPRKLSNAMSPKELEQFNLMISNIYGNACQCKLNLKDYTEAKALALKAIEANQSNVKNINRLAKCYFSLCMFGEALEQYQKCLKLDMDVNSKKQIESQIKICEQKLKQETPQEKKAYKYIFKNYSNEEEKEQKLKKINDMKEQQQNLIKQQKTEEIQKQKQEIQIQQLLEGTIQDDNFFSNIIEK